MDIRGGWTSGGDPAEPARVDALHDACGGAGITPADQIGQQLSGRRRGLDAVAALAGAPEKSLGRLIPAEGEVAVGAEGAQAGPTMLDPSDLDLERLLHPVDGDRDVQFIRLHV